MATQPEEPMTVAETISFAIEILTTVVFCRADTLRSTKKNLIMEVIHKLRQVEQTQSKQPQTREK